MFKENNKMQFNGMVKQLMQFECYKKPLTLLQEVANVFENKHKLFVAGNGGSASDCEHMCGELLKGFLLKRELNVEDKQKIIDVNTQHGEFIANSLQYGLPVISLTSHLSFITAFANDVNYENVFAQQLYVLGNQGDAVIGFSTSGNSINIRNMFITAKSKNIKTILFTGQNIGCCHQFADLIIDAPSTKTYEIQEYHVQYYHALCADLQEYFYGNKK